MPKPYDGVVFDCDATLSALEGIDQLAALAGVADAVSALTHRAMNGEVPLEAVYGERLALIRATLPTSPNNTSTAPYPAPKKPSPPCKRAA